MSRYPLFILYSVLALFFAQGIYSKEISRLITGFSRSEPKSPSSKASQPTVSKDRLHKIQMFDRMKCFPRVLCTLTKADAFKHFGGVDLNGLADGYLTLLSAFPGGPPQMEQPQQDDFVSDMIFKDNTEDYNYPNDEQVSDFGSSRGDSDDTNRDSAGNGDEEEEMLLDDPLLHQKEKMEMQKLMADLIEEEGEGGMLSTADTEEKKSSTWAQSAIALPITIPMKIGSTLLKSVIIPYLTSRRKRNLSKIASTDEQSPKRFAPVDARKVSRARVVRRLRVDNHEDPLKSAMQLWKGLKDVKQCGALFPTCPFEAWEVVSMIKLVGDQARQKRQLSAS